jgi:hypothetical protein
VPDDIIQQLLDRLDRIEQILRETGVCWTCGYAHERGVRDCIESGLTKVERSLDRLIDSYEPKK